MSTMKTISQLASCLSLHRRRHMVSCLLLTAASLLLHIRKPVWGLKVKRASHLKETCHLHALLFPLWGDYLHWPGEALLSIKRNSPHSFSSNIKEMIFLSEHVNTSALQLLAHRSSLCRKKISALSQSQTRWSTTAARQHVHRRYKSGRSFPCKQKGTHRADHRSCHRILEQVHLKEDGKTNRGINTTWQSFLYIWLCRQTNYA